MSRRPVFDPTRIQVPAEEQAARTEPAWMSVSALTQAIKTAIARALPTTLHVVGEISNYKRHSSGHVYLTLKDSHSELSCVMWRSAAGSLKFQPTDGMEVIASGQVDVYEKGGRYQFYIRRLEPRGVGALELAFRQLREKLSKEGLFALAYKKPLPAYSRRIALVTSPTGAALRDMVQTLRRRFPGVELFVYPVRVQGEGAKDEIASAIGTINRYHEQVGGIDVMIVGRGGGSLEDLWAFNEEIMARAIFASKIPVISAVGHEVDVTIADLVADVRAATPTAAAELAVPLLSDLLDRLSDLATLLDRSARHRLALAQQRLGRAAKHPAFTRPAQPLRHRGQRLDDLTTRLASAQHHVLGSLRERISRCEIRLARNRPRDVVASRARRLLETTHQLRWALGYASVLCERKMERLSHRLALASPEYRVMRLRERVDQLAARLVAGSHAKVLERGFSITRFKKKGTLVQRASQVRDGDRVITDTQDGQFESEVVNRQQFTLFGE